MTKARMNAVFLKTLQTYFNRNELDHSSLTKILKILGAVQPHQEFLYYIALQVKILLLINEVQSAKNVLDRAALASTFAENFLSRQTIN